MSIFIKKYNIQFFFFLLFVLFFSGTRLVFASSSEGVIDSIYQYAWGEDIGWINFGCNEGCNVEVNDDEITGYAWSSNFGWINLSPDNSGVKNTDEGILSGYAWSSNLGWINFEGVTISADGEFLGYAIVKSNNSQISFSCKNGDSCEDANFGVKTDWRYPRLRQKSGSFVSPPTIPIVFFPPAIVSPDITPITKVIDKIVDLLKPKPTTPIDSTIVQIPKIAPLSLLARWNLLPVEAIRSFVFAPLPYEVRILASKFPELGQTLRNVGVEKLTDMDKLSGVTFKIPGLAGREEKIMTNLGTGKISLIQGLPVANFSLSAKKDLPAEFVFARTNGELVDLNVALSISERGNVSQKISSLPGKAMRLVVKPISQARSVTGYFVFKSPTPRVFETELPRSDYSAASLFSLGSLVQAATLPTQAEQKLVLSSFEYEDPDHDGIYTADVITPSVPGEYEIITVIEYIDPTLGVRQMRMINVVDPEGYVFEKNGDNKETRIGEALVSLYYLNFSTKNYELWPAEDYQQENPQTTDVRGTYSFLVPEGSYYLKVSASGYKPYEGNVFVVSEGSGVHQNIQLTPNWDWRGILERVDLETALLVVVLLLLLYNLYYNKVKRKIIE